MKLVFTAKLAAFALLMFFILFQCVSPQYSTGYNAALIDKYNRLHSVNEPKIILVGDSNVAFGFDSGKIQNAFHMPVVNVGLYGTQGQAFYSEMIKSGIRKGDIVVLALASYGGSPYSFDYVMAWTAIENDFRLWAGISPKNYRDMALAYPSYLKRTIGLWLTNSGNKPVEGTPYAREMFNAYGDNVYPRPECVMTGESYGNYFASTDLSEEARIYWNEYNEVITEKGAVLFMSCPPIFEKTLNTELQPLQEILEDRLNFPVISKLADYVYPMEYFFDTGLHLNDTGKALRTEQFISDLSSALRR